MAEIAISNLMDVILVTGEKISKKSTLAFCLKFFATNLVLNLSIVLSGLNFFLRTYLQPIVLQPVVNLLTSMFCWKLVNLFHHSQPLSKIQHQVITKLLAK